MARNFELNFRLGAQMAGSFAKTITNAQTALGGLTSRVAQLSSQSGDTKRVMDLRDAVNAAGLKFSFAEARVEQLRNAISKNQKPTRAMTSELSKAEREAAKAGRELTTLKTRLDGAERSAKTMGKSTAQLAAQQSKLERSAKKAAAAQQGLQKALNARSANKAWQADLRGQMMSTAAMAAVMAAPVKIAADFQQQLATVGAKGGYRAEDMAKLREQARKLGAETVWSASEAAKGMEFLAMAGFNANDTMAAMPGLLDLASAAGSELGVTADIASDILSGFGIEAAEMGRVSDVLAKATTTSNTNLEMLGDTMKYVAPIARTAGMSLEETAAMAGLLANVGIKSSQAGTSMKAMLLQLTSKKAVAEMERLGVAARDSDGNMRNMVEVMADMAKATESMGSFDRLESLAKIFGREPAAGMAELIEKGGSDAISAYVGIMEGADGTAARIAADMNNTFYGSMKQMASASQELMITVGDALIPTLREFTDTLTKITAGVGQWTKENPELTQTIVKITAGLVALKVATLAGAYAFSVAKGAMLTANVIMKTIRASTLLFNAALWANPITLIVAGIVAGVAIIGTAAYLLWKNWDAVSEKLGQVWEQIKRGASVAWEAIKNVITWPMNTVLDFFRNFSLFDSGKAIFQTLIDGLKSMGGALIDAVSGAFGKVRDMLPFSDAKAGPFAQLTASGAAIMETLGEGIERAGANPMLRPFTAAADAMMFGPNAVAGALRGAATGLGGGGAGGVSMSFQITQNISLGGSDAGLEDRAREGAATGAEDLVKEVKKAIERERRLSFGD